MTEVRGRAKAQAPPVEVIFEALTEPDRDPVRRWLNLRPDEQRPTVLEAVPASSVVWSSIFVRHPGATIHFDITRAPVGCRLGWVLRTPDELTRAAASSVRHRLNVMINADLRFTFGR